MGEQPHARNDEHGKSEDENTGVGPLVHRLHEHVGQGLHDADGLGSFDFGDNNLGSFPSATSRAELDYRFTQRDGKPAVEFSFEGGDGATARLQRSWLDDSGR